MANKPTGDLNRKILSFLAQLRSYYRLYPVVFAVLLLLIALQYIVAQPRYTATAVVGPANPSPTNTLLSAMNTGSGVTASIARRLVGGDSGGGNDPFQEYVQLLNSSRIANELAKKDNLLPRVFYRQWDTEAKRWTAPGMVWRTLAMVKQFMHRPVVDHPTDDTLGEYLKQHLTTAPAQGVNASPTMNLSMASMYLVVSIDAESPKEAEDLLSLILWRADETIRQEQLRDVRARIACLQSEIPSVTDVDQRQSLIQMYSNQEELKVMMVADNRYASTLVVPPHASVVPSSPMRPSRAVIVCVLLSGLVWMILVAIAPRWRFLDRHISRLKVD